MTRIKVNLSTITTDYKLQQRVSEDASHIKQLIESIKEIGLQEPLKVVQSSDDDSLLWLVDGYHRFKACDSVGLKEVEVEVVEVGDFRSAFMQSLKVNSTNGLALARGEDDLKKAIHKYSTFIQDEAEQADKRVWVIDTNEVMQACACSKRYAQMVLKDINDDLKCERDNWVADRLDEKLAQGEIVKLSKQLCSRGKGFSVTVIKAVVKDLKAKHDTTEKVAKPVVIAAASQPEVVAKRTNNWHAVSDEETAAFLEAEIGGIFDEPLVIEGDSHLQQDLMPESLPVEDAVLTTENVALEAIRKVLALGLDMTALDGLSVEELQAVTKACSEVMTAAETRLMGHQKQAA
ncbi:ParB/Srx family N-terminal domain-containing protein [Parendozoicomonas haliclonae]|uniref:ParB-like nuclease domain protein n=1 Tax=Parendozoicomonas haliclonae TaxID=1960125 RepID=A0A1X7AKG5_9GAMM|nr:ParB/Srx family N-terminal domain-containing protein [Parendozoicomonas haliclonae]SMA47377.1 ParB-like nuclease domain protein [Parendozoicomonas haliclonae]